MCESKVDGVSSIERGTGVEGVRWVRALVGRSHRQSQLSPGRV